MPSIKVLIVDDTDDTRASIHRLLGFERGISVVGEAENGTEALRLTGQLQPDVVLMDINMPQMDGLRTTELLTAQHPGVCVMIMSVQDEQKLFRRAMTAGAKDYIVKPFSGKELFKAIERVYRSEKRKRLVQGKVEPEAAAVAAARKGELITFFSTKGGVGKSTIAANTAVVLAEQGYRVLLLDLNLQFGDIPLFLNLTPKRTLADLAQGGSFRYEDIQAHCVTHSSGLQVLAAPSRPEYADLIHPEQIGSILESVKPHFDYIFCDTVNRFEDISLLVLDKAQAIWLVVAMDLPTLKNAKLSLDVLQSLQYKDKVQIVVNRSTNDLGMNLKDVAFALGQPVYVDIPSDGRALLRALNKGEPFVLLYPQSKASEGIRLLIKALTVDNERIPSVPRKGWLRFGKGGLQPHVSAKTP